MGRRVINTKPIKTTSINLIEDEFNNFNNFNKLNPFLKITTTDLLNKSLKLYVEDEEFRKLIRETNLEK